MRFFVGVFAVFGLLLHYRLYRVFGDPVLLQQFEAMEEGSRTLWDLLLFLTIPWVPYLFYGMCLLSILVKSRSRLTLAIVVGLTAISLPYFATLYNLDPSTAKMCLYAGGLALINHLKQPTKKSRDDGLLLVT